MRVAVITLVALAALLMPTAGPAYGQEIPPLPHAFYGAIEINGAPAPVVTSVEDRGDGVRTGIEGNPIVTVAGGFYGSPDPMGSKLIVQGNIAEGTTINFYINSSATSYTAVWHSGEVTELNMTMEIATLPPTVTPEATTGVGMVAATLNGRLTDPGSASSVSVSFEWGMTTSYGSETAPQTMSNTAPFSAALGGLRSRTVYHFRAKAVGEGTAYGLDRAFTTGGGGGGGGGGGAKDILAPTIKNIKVTNISKTGADISWNTDEMSDSQVEYWSSPGQLSPLDATKTIDHLVHLSGLAPGNTCYFKVMSKDDAGNQAVSDQHSFTTLPGIPALTASKLSISPGEVYTGEKVTITITVVNTGDGAGSYKVMLKINGELEESREVNIKAGGSQELVFTSVKDVAGDYSVVVDGLSGSFRVKEKPAPSPGEPAATPSQPEATLVPSPSPTNLSWPWVWGIIGAVLLVGMVIFVLTRRNA